MSLNGHLKPQVASNPQGAYFGGSVQNAWTPFFGQGNYPFQTNPYDEKKRATWVLPENLKGRNIYLQTTLELLSFLRDAWYTQVAMPMEYTDATHVEWSKYEFAPKFANLVPERGTVRLVRSRRYSGQATFERRGVGFLLTHGFMNTEEGREHYRMNLEQIAQSVIETNNFGVVYAYLTADDYSKQWEKDQNFYRGKQMKEILAFDLDTWDIFKKQKNGGEVLDVEVKRRMDRYKGVANMWIMPEKIGMWYTLAPENKTEYWLGGAGAVANITDGVEAFRTFGVGAGMSTVYLARTYDVDQESIDILRFPAQIGDYHTMFDTMQGSDYKGYNSRCRSIQIFDEDADRFSEISQREAIRHMKRHDGNGKLIHINDNSNLRYDPRYELSERYSDFLHFIDQQGEPQTASFFGNINLELGDVQDVVKTLFLSLPLVFPQSQNHANNPYSAAFNVFNSGLNALAVIENIPFNQRAQEFVDALIAANAGQPRSFHLGTPNVGPSIPLGEVQSNIYGGLDVPDLNGGNPDGGQKLALPPFFGNWPGFQAIAEASRNKLAKAFGYNEELFRQVEQFVELIDVSVAALQNILPGNPALDARYASSWWHKPNAATVLFENLIGRHRYPAFLKVGPAGAAAPAAPSRARSRIGRDINREPAQDFAKQQAVSTYASYIKTVTDNKDKFDPDNLSDATKKSLGGTKVRALEQAKAIYARVEERLDGPQSLDQVLEEAKAAAVTAYALAQIRYNDDGDDSAELENADAVATLAQNAIVPNVVANRDTPLTVLTNLDQYVKDVGDFFTENSGSYRGNNPGQVAGRIRRILKNIDALKESAKDAQNPDERAAYSVGIQGGEKRQAAASALVFEEDEFARAPITLSPTQITSIYDTGVSGKAEVKIWPVSTENPDVAITATEWTNVVQKINHYSRDARAFGELHHTLRPIGAGLGYGRDSADMNNFGIVQSIASYMKRTASGDRSFDSVTPVYSSGLASSAASSLIGAPLSGRALELQQRAEQAAGSRVRPGSGSVGSRRPGGQHTADYESLLAGESVIDSAGTGSGGARGLRSVGGGSQGSAPAFYNQGIADGMDQEHVSKLLDAGMSRALLNVEQQLTNRLDRLFAQLFLLTPTDERNFFALDTHNVLIPVEWLVVRPHQRYETYTIIKAQAGRETGATYMGNSHFTLGDDAATQVHTGTYTYYSKSVVFQPKNVFVVRNSFVDGYNGGGGIEPYVLGDDTYDPANGVYGRERARGGSTFFFVVPRGDSNSYSGPISITGKFDAFDEEIYDFARGPLHFNTAPYYNRYWGFRNMAQDQELIAPQWTYINEYASPNNIAHQGHTLYWHQPAQAFTGVRYSNGHWPSDTIYPGCGRIRQGKIKSFDKQDWVRGFHMV